MLDCKRLGKATYSVARIHGPNGGGCKCCDFYFWFISTWGEYALYNIFPYGFLMV